MRWFVLFLLLLLAAACEAQAAPPIPPVGQHIREYCRGAQPCVDRQKAAARHFMGIWVMFDGDSATAERCMRAAATETDTAGRRLKAPAARFIDWTKAEACMRDWSKGRENIIARGMKKK